MAVSRPQSLRQAPAAARLTCWAVPAQGPGPSMTGGTRLFWATRVFCSEDHRALPSQAWGRGPRAPWSPSSHTQTGPWCVGVMLRPSPWLFSNCIFLLPHGHSRAGKAHPPQPFLPDSPKARPHRLVQFVMRKPETLILPETHAEPSPVKSLVLGGGPKVLVFLSRHPVFACFLPGI